MATRQQVYAAIDGERNYQEAGLGNSKTDSPTKPVGEWVLLMEEAIAQARAAFYKPHPEGRLAALHLIRKATALGVRCMEQNGAPTRIIDGNAAP